MAVYTYRTDQCKRDIKQQKFEDEVRAFEDRIRKTQRTDVFDRFPPPFLKKRFTRQIRLVAEERHVGTDTVVVFQRVLVRGGKEYKSFCHSSYKELPGKVDASELTENTLQTYIDSLQEEPPPPPPKPSAGESAYLNSALVQKHDIYRDFHCCETQLWAETIAKDTFADRLSLFVETIFDTVDSTENGLAEARCKKDSRYGILYRRIPELKMVLLFTPFRDEPPIERVKKAYPDLLNSKTIHKEQALKRAKRAYPHALLLSEDAWFQVQRDREGNMALSEEEIEVLESARSQSGGYPLFINGRAGSGKSTILQYLFSEYIFHHLQGSGVTDPPVFFACNDELLTRAGESVRSLVDSQMRENDHAAAIEAEFTERLSGIVRKTFLNFHTWLRTLANDERFAPETRIDYGRFKQWWEGKFGRDSAARRLYDADISWHIIRTYIKGTSAEGYLDPEDYLELPSKWKSVTQESYSIVFEKVWKSLENDQKEYGYWDDQDLARFVLESNLIESRHPVVFCDEVQDFTRIELEVLHRHSLFTQRTLNAFEQTKIPFAFAGDPFQTLNPTGFRWEATKAFFTEKFIKSYPGQRKGDLNYRELCYNYRSSGHIVKFCNTLQLFRKVIFGFNEIKPQHPWDDGGDMPNVCYFEKSDPSVLEALKDQSEIRIIVPCEEGGEGEWARTNGLADFVQFDDADVPKNVVSPTRVKGLEFTRVVLFGFGGACPASLRKAISDPGNALEGDSAIEPQYFLNRLYVAASRPRKRLFIIDSPGDIESFWNQIFTTNQEDFILHTDDEEKWEDMCGQIFKGAGAFWEGDREDPVETAEKLAREGRLRKDRILLRQAAQSYSHANRATQAKTCRAEALELEGEYLKAAEMWLEVESPHRSVSAAWKAERGGYEFIIRLAAKHPELRNRMHFKVANYLGSKADMGEGVTLLKDLIEGLENEKFREEVVTERAWTNAMVACLKKMAKSRESGSGLWASAYSRVLDLVKEGVRFPATIMGEFAYRANELSQAYAHWEKASPTEQSQLEDKFLRAKAATVGFPHSLSVYSELLARYKNRKDAAEILDIVQRENASGPDVAEIMVRARILLGEYSKLMDSEISALSNLALLEELIDYFVKRKENEGVLAVLRQVFSVLADQRRWSDLIKVAKNRSLKPVRNDADKGSKTDELKNWSRPNFLLFDAAFVRFTALGNKLESARNDEKTEVATLIRNRFNKGFDWKAFLHPLIVGRAFEKAGLFKETLPFYEAVAASPQFSAELRELAVERWVLTKFAQSKWEAENGNKARAQKAEREAVQKARGLGLKGPDEITAELPEELPVVDAAAPVATKKAPTLAPKDNGASSEARKAKPDESAGPPEVERLPAKDTPKTKKASAATPGKLPKDKDYSLKRPFDEFEVRIRKDGLRVNLEHLEKMVVVSIFVDRQGVNVDGKELAPDKHSLVAIDDIGLTIDFSVVGSGKLRFETSDGTEFALPVAPVSRNQEEV